MKFALYTAYLSSCEKGTIVLILLLRFSKF